MSRAPCLDPARPRVAATLLLLRDDPFEVMMVRRGERRDDAFSAALVFPGGVVDPEDAADEWHDLIDGAGDLSDDERALRIAACRETYEEAGVLIAAHPDGSVMPTPMPTPIVTRKRFAETVRAAGLRLPLHDLVHFAHWITPVDAARRFDTHFFLCRAPVGAVGRCDGYETVALEWTAPRDVLARARAGSEHILFPTRLNLERLAESEDVAGALAAARARPRFTVEPRTELRHGRRVVVIAEESGYGVTEDWRS